MEKTSIFRINGRSIILLIAILTVLILDSCQKEELTTFNESSVTQMDSPKLKSASTPDYLMDLIQTIETMVDDGILTKGNGNALIVKINNAIKSLEKGNYNAFDGQLSALINNIESLIDNEIISMEEGEILIAKAENGIILSKGSFIDTRDGNEYKVVLIGDQIWMAENLAYLPSVSPSNVGSEIDPHFYVYDYNGTDVAFAKTTYNYNTYGVLYNWAAAMNGESASESVPSGVQGICPEGWHIPSMQEWKNLVNMLGGASIAGGKIKETGTEHWLYPNTGATNEVGFTALPAGSRTSSFGTFDFIGEQCDWHTTVEFSSTTMCYMHLHNAYASLVGVCNVNKAEGLAVRCIKD